MARGRTITEKPAVDGKYLKKLGGYVVYTVVAKI